MFIAFYVAFTDDPEYSFGAEHVAPGRDRESFLVFPKTSFPTTQAQERVLDQIAAHLGISSETHYRALVSRTKHMLHLGDLRDAHRDAPLAFTRLASPKRLFTKEWFEKLKADRELKQSVGKAFQAYAELEDAKTHCLRLARSRDESFEGDRLLRSQKGYTLEQLQEVEEWSGSHLLEALRFLAEESRSHKLQWAAFNGPLVGGIIAIAATLLTLWLI